MTPTPDSLLGIASRRAAVEGIDEWRALMLVLLAELRDLDPSPELSDVHGVAADYWENRSGDPEALMAAKKRCWAFLDLHKTDDMRTVQARHVRALLGVLEPSGDKETASTTAEWVCLLSRDPG